MKTRNKLYILPPITIPNTGSSDFSDESFTLDDIALNMSDDVVEAVSDFLTVPDRDHPQAQVRERDEELLSATTMRVVPSSPTHEEVPETADKQIMNSVSAQALPAANKAENREFHSLFHSLFIF